MKIRLKDEYFLGHRKRAKKPIEDDSVLPGCYKPEERKALKERYQQEKLTAENYDKQRMELANDCPQKESKDLITMDLHHGDLVVMHGTSLQKYYEHSVESEEKLRFALTARYVKPEQVGKTEQHKGKFKLEGDQVYDGK